MRNAKRYVSVTSALVLAGSLAGCGGDDTAATGGDGGITGSGGSTTSSGGRGGSAGLDGASGQGGTADQGGAAGQGGTAGLGGSGGAGGTSGSDAGRDARNDVFTGGGGIGDAASDRLTSDARDGAPASDAPVADRNDAGAGDGSDGHVCPTPSGDGSVHVNLYTFDVVDGSATGIEEWSTYNAGPITTSTDDSAYENTSTPGSLHARVTFPLGFGLGSSTLIERSFNNAQDYSCFTKIHMSVKITSPASALGLMLGPYITDINNVGAFGMPWSSFSNPNLASVADGNWHELVTTLVGPKSTIAKIGLDIEPPASAPDAGTDASTDGGSIPDPVDVFIDNVWLE